VSACLLTYVSRMRGAWALPSSVAWQILIYFSTFFPHFVINGMVFEKKLLSTKCVFWFSLHLLSGKFLTLRRTLRGSIKMYIVFLVKCPLFLSDFNETWILSADFRKVLKYQISRKSASGSRVIALGRTDGQTDMTKLIVAFRNFASAS